MKRLTMKGFKFAPHFDVTFLSNIFQHVKPKNFAYVGIFIAVIIDRTTNCKRHVLADLN